MVMVMHAVWNFKNKQKELEEVEDGTISYR